MFLLIGLMISVSGCGEVASPAAAVSSPSEPATPASRALDLEMPDSGRRRLNQALNRFARSRPGTVAAAAYDRATGVGYSFRDDSAFMLASVAKVDILTALLFQAQQAGRTLTREERTLASRMIRQSDNVAAHRLYTAIGGHQGLSRVLTGLGIHNTRPGTGLLWGATLSHPSDQVRLLDVLSDPEGPLIEPHRRYAMRLMTTVTPTQAWGVSAGAAKGTIVALKNGWLPAQSQGGLWTVNSIGRLTWPGHDLLIAVLSERSPTMAAGITTVERVATLITRALNKIDMPDYSQLRFHPPIEMYGEAR
ncbi:hypothetical protein Ssi02_19030 [Sinosporangium siamense]|uniref:Beta-lactamase class A catalytic domain-containing protein n=1 Tax=Sinosporangium siamense TaxID=1367973 RepID=A0A919RDG3_9ACTN|nr:hypothetical protein Ssi02_19030 [Sinosporangium siamense]